MRDYRTITADIKVEGSKVEGYALVYNSPSVPMDFGKGKFVEVIRSGAATDALKKGDIPALYQHKTDNILGRTSSGTLRLQEDSKGVAYSLDLPDTSLGRDVKELIKRGDIRGASFCLEVLPGGDTWTKTAEGKLREITRLDIHEITLTPFPAYPETSAALRSYEEWEQQQKQIPLALRAKQVIIVKL